MSMFVLIIVVLTVPLLSAVAVTGDSPSSKEDVRDEEHCEGVCMQDSSVDIKVKENTIDQEEKAVVCYFTNWASNREGKASFKPEDIDASLCTHVIYSFSMPKDNTFVRHDLKTDLPIGYFKSVTDLKKKGVKVIIYFGGWDNPNCKIWSEVLNSATARKHFATSIAEFLERHNFDGLDFGYSYPGCPKGNMEAALPNAKADFNQLLTELKTAFKGKYLLTVPTPAVKEYIDKCYDMTELCKIVDWVNLTSYKYHSYEDGVTGAQSPMCGLDWTVSETIKHYLDVVKCPPEKLVLGLAFYTQTYTMADASPAKFGVPVSGPGAPGPFTKLEGWVAYYETCLMIKDGYEHGYNKVNGTYAWKDKQFLSFEGIADVSRKACLINELNLKGANMWTMDYDDFKNMCGCGAYPLLKTLNQHLRGLQTTPIQCY